MFMLRQFSAVLLILGVLLVISCATHIHEVGNGAQSNDMTTARQWYFLFGLAPINEVSTYAMAGKATDYEIKTEATVVDSIISAFTGAIISCRTVTVRK